MDFLDGIKGIVELKKAQVYDLPNRNYENYPVSDAIILIAKINILVASASIYWFLVKWAAETNQKLFLMCLAIAYIMVAIGLAWVSTFNKKQLFLPGVLLFNLTAGYWFITLR